MVKTNMMMLLQVLFLPLLSAVITALPQNYGHDHLSTDVDRYKRGADYYNYQEMDTRKYKSGRGQLNDIKIDESYWAGDQNIVGRDDQENAIKVASSKWEGNQNVVNGDSEEDMYYDESLEVVDQTEKYSIMLEDYQQWLSLKSQTEKKKLNLREATFHYQNFMNWALTLKKNWDLNHYTPQDGDSLLKMFKDWKALQKGRIREKYSKLIRSFLAIIKHGEDLDLPELSIALPHLQRTSLKAMRIKSLRKRQIEWPTNEGEGNQEDIVLLERKRVELPINEETAADEQVTPIEVKRVELPLNEDPVSEVPLFSDEVNQEELPKDEEPALEPSISLQSRVVNASQSEEQTSEETSEESYSKEKISEDEEIDEESDKSSDSSDVFPVRRVAVKDNQNDQPRITIKQDEMKEITESIEEKQEILQNAKSERSKLSKLLEDYKLREEQTNDPKMKNILQKRMELTQNKLEEQIKRIKALRKEIMELLAKKRTQMKLDKQKKRIQELRKQRLQQTDSSELSNRQTKEHTVGHYSSVTSHQQTTYYSSKSQQGYQINGGTSEANNNNLISVYLMNNKEQTIDFSYTEKQSEEITDLLGKLQIMMKETKRDGDVLAQLMEEYKRNVERNNELHLQGAQQQRDKEFLAQIMAQYKRNAERCKEQKLKEAQLKRDKENLLLIVEQYKRKEDRRNEEAQKQRDREIIVQLMEQSKRNEERRKEEKIKEAQQQRDREILLQLVEQSKRNEERRKQEEKQKEAQEQRDTVILLQLMEQNKRDEERRKEEKIKDVQQQRDRELIIQLVEQNNREEERRKEQKFKEAQEQREKQILLQFQADQNKRDEERRKEHYIQITSQQKKPEVIATVSSGFSSPFIASPIAAVGAGLFGLGAGLQSIGAAGMRAPSTTFYKSVSVGGGI